MIASNDSSELEALFDSIASTNQPVVPVPTAAPAPVAAMKNDGDNDDLQALFDSVAAEAQGVVAEVPEQAAPTVASDAQWLQQEAVFNRIGHMARTLHDTLTELGYDKVLENAVSALPDAQDRLAYIANLTEQAACRVLNATDIAGPLVSDIEKRSQQLGESWDKVFANQLGTEEFKVLAADTRLFLKQQLPEKAGATHAQLTEIMMAQDFQDLTGQVIKKIVGVAQELESGLMKLLIEVLPEARRTKEVTSLMNGPVIKAEGRNDVVVNQKQVDDLLESLGF